jgi:hypothetical protein
MASTSDVRHLRPRHRLIRRWFLLLHVSVGQHIEDLQLCLVLAVMGVLAIAVPFLPDAWIGGEKADERRRLGFRFLLGFAAVGFVPALVFTLSPPYTFQSIRAAVFWLCPACAPGMLNGESFIAVLFTAFLNAVFFGAVGGVIGTVFSIVLGQLRRP